MSLDQLNDFELICNGEKCFTFPIDIIERQAEPDDEKKPKWFVSGFATTVDLGVDDIIITKEALEEAAQDLLNRPTLLFNHNPDRPIGRVIEVEAREKGLWVKALISCAEMEIWEKVTEGVISKFSIRGKILDRKSKWSKEYNKQITVASKLLLLECSLVSVPGVWQADIIDWWIERDAQLEELLDLVEDFDLIEEGGDLEVKKVKEVLQKSKSLEEPKEEEKVEEPKKEEEKTEEPKEEEVIEREEPKEEEKVEEPKEEEKVEREEPLEGLDEVIAQAKTDYQKFMSECMGKGTSMTECAKEWKKVKRITEPEEEKVEEPKEEEKVEEPKEEEKVEEPKEEKIDLSTSELIEQVKALNDKLDALGISAIPVEEVEEPKEEEKIEAVDRQASTVEQLKGIIKMVDGLLKVVGSEEAKSIIQKIKEKVSALLAGEYPYPAPEKKREAEEPKEEEKVEEPKEEEKVEEPKEEEKTEEPKEEEVIEAIPDDLAKKEDIDSLRGWVADEIERLTTQWDEVAGLLKTLSEGIVKRGVFVEKEEEIPRLEDDADYQKMNPIEKLNRLCQVIK